MKNEHTNKYVRVNNSSAFIIASIARFKFAIIGLLIISIIWSIDLSLKSYLLKIMVDSAEGVKHNRVIDALGQPVLFYVLLLMFIFIVSRVDEFIWLKLKPNLQKYIGIHS